MLFYTGWKHLKKRGKERKSFKAMEGEVKGNREREGLKKLLGKGGGGERFQRSHRAFLKENQSAF